MLQFVMLVSVKGSSGIKGKQMSGKEITGLTRPSP